MKKGFATSAILYTMLLLFLVLMVGILNNLQNKKVILDALKQDTIYALGQDTVVDAILDQIGMLQNKITELESQIEAMQGEEKKGGIIYRDWEPFQSSTTLAYTGISLEVPANSYACLTAKAIYMNAVPQIVAISTSQSKLGSSEMKAIDSTTEPISLSTTFCGFTTTNTSYYIWARYDRSNENAIKLEGFYIPRS